MAGQPFSLAEIFERLTQGAEAPLPGIPYHYTTLTAFEKIMRSQEFWATSSDCTNDSLELRTADEAIVRLAKRVRSECSVEFLRQVFSAFIAKYESEPFSSQGERIYLTCFSLERDLASQWERYGDSGRGVCIGLQLLNEEPLKSADWVAQQMLVEYSQNTWEAKILHDLRMVARNRSFRPSNLLPTKANVGTLVACLNGMVSGRAVSCKDAKWEKERELRRILVKKPESGLTELIRKGAVDGCTPIKYVSAPLRAPGKRIALQEVIIGPNQDFETGRAQVLEILRSADYSEAELPVILPSTARLP